MASEEALRQAGEFGRFQYLIVAFLGLVTAPFIALVVFGHIFTLLEPPHWCHVPQLDALNLTVEQKKTLSIPKTELDGIIQFSKCQAYEVNFTHIFLDHNGSVPKPAQWWPVADCKHGWDYDYSLIYPTVVSEMNWVCEESWKMLMCHTVFWATSAVGVIVWGTISDMYGRIPVLVITSGIAGGAGIATMFFTEFIPFLIIRSVMGFVFLSLSITSFVLVIEYVVTSKRLTASSVFQFMYPVAASVIPWVAYYLKSWRKLSLIVSVPAFTIPVFCWFMPESLRWLVSKGKDEKAKVIISRIAHINGKHLPENYIETLKLIDISDVNKKKITIMDLLKTSNLRKNFLLTLVVWIICSTLYVGGQMYAATVMDNPFIMTSITCFVDVLATGISVPLADKWGRRPSMVAMFGMSSIAYFMISFVSSGNTLVIAIVAFIGRLALTTGYNAAYLHAAEVYPTVARTQAMAARQTFGSIGAFLAPQITYLAIYGKYLPLVVYSSLASANVFFTFMLPETLNKDLPESLVDGENFGRNQNLCCRKLKKRNVLPLNFTQVTIIEDDTNK